MPWLRNDILENSGKALHWYFVNNKINDACPTNDDHDKLKKKSKTTVDEYVQFSDSFHFVGAKAIGIPNFKRIIFLLLQFQSFW